jgi:hypothetical protein
MKGVAKVAIGIPVETLKSLERVRSRLRKTRSAAISEAIARWLAAEELGAGRSALLWRPICGVRNERLKLLLWPEPRRSDGSRGNETRRSVVGQTSPPAGHPPVVLVSRDSAYAVRRSATVVKVTMTVRAIAAEVPLSKGIPPLSPEKMAGLDAALRFSLSPS